MCHNDTLQRTWKGDNLSDKPKQGISVIATGILGSDPKSAGKYTVARLAVSQPGKKRPDGEWDNQPSMWYDVMAAGDQLEGGTKGQYVTVEGRLSMRLYQEKPQWTIWAEKVTEAVAKGSEQGSSDARRSTKSETPELAFPE